MIIILLDTILLQIINIFFIIEVFRSLDIHKMYEWNIEIEIIGIHRITEKYFLFSIEFFSVDWFGVITIGSVQKAIFTFWFT